MIFSVPIRFGQTNEDVASIIKQNDKTRRQPTVRQIIRDEAAPAPLVLQLVEYVFPLGAIAREMAKTLGMGANILDGGALGDSKTAGDAGGRHVDRERRRFRRGASRAQVP